MKFTLGSLDLASKAAAIKLVRSTIETYTTDTRLTDEKHDDFQLFEAVIKLRPASYHQLVGSEGVAYFRIAPTHKATPELYVYGKVREIEFVVPWYRYMKEHIISVHAIKPASQSSSKRTLHKLMRTSIQYQMKLYRRRNKHVQHCANCNVRMRNSQLQVDHIKPFKLIRDEFLAGCPESMIPRSFTYIGKERAFRPEHKSFKQRWEKQHLKETTDRLQMACPDCNQSVFQKKGYKRTTPLLVQSLITRVV